MRQKFCARRGQTAPPVRKHRRHSEGSGLLSQPPVPVQCTMVLPKGKAGLENRELCSSLEVIDFIWNRAYKKLLLKMMAIFAVSN